MHAYSRYRYSTVQNDAMGRRFLSPPVRLSYQPFPDNREHVVKEGDTLSRIAGVMLRGLPEPYTLGWIIAWYQPVPIHDPTLVLTVGRKLYVPSIRTVHEYVFNAKRRDA